MPRCVFRCDASARIGNGHLARCMALARALRSRGAEIELISRELSPRVRDVLVAPSGALVHELPAHPDAAHASSDAGAILAHAHWLPLAQEADAEQTAGVLHTRFPVDWLIVDHYAMDARWERIVKRHVDNLLVIDDLADRDHSCDALLDQNFFYDAHARYAGRVPLRAELMLGPRFALLREEFPAARPKAPRPGELRRIFLCFGGYDASGQTVRALQAIDSAALEATAVDVVIGSAHSQRAQIESFCAQRRAWEVHFDVADIARLMARADLGIGASGIMNWERAALALPAIVASVAENQDVVARDLAEERACIYLGRADEWRVETLAGLLRGLSGTPTLLRALSKRAAALTDGQGARRVAERLLPRRIALRRAAARDCDAVHAWRNAEETRRHAADPSVIPLARHREWFARALDDSGIALLLAEQEGRPVGVLRYDVDGGRAIVSVYLVPGLHGAGIGSALLRAGSVWIREHFPAVSELRAEVRRDNMASRTAFENAGYTLEGHDFRLDMKHE